MRHRRTATQLGPAGAISGEGKRSHTWSSLYEDFSVAERERAERQRALELAKQHERDRALRANGMLQQLMSSLFTYARQRAQELEQRTGVSVQVRHCERPPLSSILPHHVRTPALKLTANASFVYVYAAPTEDPSVLHLHLLPCRVDSIRRAERLVSELAGVIVVQEAGYELRLVNKAPSAAALEANPAHLNAPAAEGCARIDSLLLRAFRSLLQVSSGASAGAVSAGVSSVTRPSNPERSS